MTQNGIQTFGLPTTLIYSRHELAVETLPIVCLAVLLMIPDDDVGLFIDACIDSVQTSKGRRMLISEYVKTDWLLYSSQNVLRSLPSFKDGQVLTTRKLLFALRNQQEYEVVERLGLKAASMTAYKNGGSSISNSLAGMGKSYAGSNNVPLFDGDGQFGTAIDNDTSETRYISVKISDNFRDWFSKDDDDILPLRVERGDELEYQWMAPIAPIALVNGAFGIATGYASNIQCHHPLDVIEGVIDVLNNGAPSKRLLPSWVDWKGTVERIDDSGTKFTATGKSERVNATSETCV